MAEMPVPPRAEGLCALYCPGCRTRWHDYEPGVAAGRLLVKCPGERCHRYWLVQVFIWGLRLEELPPVGPAPRTN